MDFEYSVGNSVVLIRHTVRVRMSYRNLYFEMGQMGLKYQLLLKYDLRQREKSTATDIDGPPQFPPLLQLVLSSLVRQSRVHLLPVYLATHHDLLLHLE